MKKKKIKIIKNYKGDLVKFYNFNQKLLNKYEEIYFSIVKKKYFKGWKYHENRNQIMTIGSGNVIFSIKKTKNGKEKKIKMSFPDNIYLLKIPKKTFYSFRCTSKKDAIIINIIDEII